MEREIIGYCSTCGKPIYRGDWFGYVICDLFCRDHADIYDDLEEE